MNVSSLFAERVGGCSDVRHTQPNLPWAWHLVEHFAGPHLRFIFEPLLELIFPVPLNRTCSKENVRRTTAQAVWYGNGMSQVSGAARMAMRSAWMAHGAGVAEDARAPRGALAAAAKRSWAHSLDDAVVST